MTYRQLIEERVYFGLRFKREKNLSQRGGVAAGRCGGGSRKLSVYSSTTGTKKQRKTACRESELEVSEA